MQDRLRWLLTRLRVARQGYGLSLVPEWEQSGEQIAADLGSEYNNLSAALDGYAAALPTPAEQARQRVANHYFLAEQLERGSIQRRLKIWANGSAGWRQIWPARLARWRCPSFMTRQP